MNEYTPTFPTFSYYAQNPFILKWWKAEHDQVLLSQIKKEHWIWSMGITNLIVEITPKDIIKQWQEEDPLCKQYAWYNILTNFAESRAKQLGFTSFIRTPQEKICPICNKMFSEAWIAPSLIRCLGINSLDICNNCMSYKFSQNSGGNSINKEEIIKYFQKLVEIIQVIPYQNFGESPSSLKFLNTEQRVAVLKINDNRPSIKRVKEIFGSWLNALIQSGIIEGETIKMKIGTRCIAKDGHVCLSLGEKTIDDYLFINEICHDKEPRYPEGNYKGDFLCGNIIIEYFGLFGQSEYDKKTKEKINICKRHNIKLVEIYPQDLVFINKLDNKLSFLKTH